MEDCGKYFINLLRKSFMNKKPLILVTNDDGINAPGLSAYKVMSDIGEALVVAPDSPRSAMGHAITINSILHCKK